MHIVSLATFIGMHVILCVTCAILALQYRTQHLQLSAACVNGRTYFRPLGSSSTLLPCIKPIRDSSESSSQAEAFITNRPCSPSTPNVHCHRIHSISYLRQQMQRCIPFPIPGNRCRISSLYNYAVSPVLDRTSSTINFFLWITVHFR